MKAPFLIGRIIFGGFFLYNGINHIVNRKQMAPYAGAKGVPEPEWAVMLSGIPILIGGASIALGIKPKIGAAAILAFLGGVSPIMHNFWASEDPNQRQADMIHFAKNMALAGGAIALMGIEEPWEASVPIAQPKPSKKLRGFARRLAA